MQFQSKYPAHLIGSPEAWWWWWCGGVSEHLDHFKAKKIFIFEKLYIHQILLFGLLVC
jgi:hypothetical protein